MLVQQPRLRGFLRPLHTDLFYRVAPYIRQQEDDARYTRWELLRHINSGYCRKPEEEKDTLKAQLRESDGPFLSAVNTEGRIRFFSPWIRYGHEFAAGHDTYLVTLVRRKDVRDLQRAHQINPRSVIEFARFWMRGFDYYGILETALYTNFQIDSMTSPLVSPHTHMIVRDCDSNQLRQVVQQINRRYDALVPGCPAADMRPIQGGDHNYIMYYISKEPTHQYRIKPVRREVINSQTGEYEYWMTGRFRQESDRASPGVQLKARSAIALWHMDKLAFAGGDGTPLLNAARREALSGLTQRQERSGRQRVFGGYFEQSDYDEQI